MAKISVKNLSKVFGFGAKHALKQYKEGKPRKEILNDTGNAVALFDVSLDVQQGEILVVMGLSGSGKSTFVRCLNRLIDPTAGSIQVDGTDITALSTRELRELRQKNFGMVFQDFALLPHRSVLENTVFGLEIMGVAKAVRHKKGMEALALVGLGGWENSFPHQLSGGMRQRVGLARALAIDPPVLLMDEAFSALDPLIRRDMQDALLGLQSELRKTIVFITHDLDEALKLGDRIVILRAGRVVQTGAPEDILTSPADDYVARFVSSADVTHVLTAERIMKRSEAVAVLGHDGPRAALRAMRTHSITNLFVLDRERKFEGIVNAEDVEQLSSLGRRELEPVVQRDIVTVLPDTPVSELIRIMSNLPYPLAVVNENRRLQGVIVRGLLLGALTETRGKTE